MNIRTQTAGEKMKRDILDEHFEKGFEDLREMSGHVSEEERTTHTKNLLRDQEEVLALVSLPGAKKSLAKFVCTGDSVKNVATLIKACDSNHMKVFGLSDGLEHSDPNAEDARIIDGAVMLLKNKGHALYAQHKAQFAKLRTQGKQL